MILLSSDSYDIKTTKEKGFGFFVKQDILPGTLVGDYLGKLINYKDADRYEKKYGLYDFHYSDKYVVCPDLSKPDVYAINHSCMANCDIFRRQRHSIIFTLRYIFAGEELSFQYGLPHIDGNREISPCHCQTLLCRGHMCAPTADREKRTDDFFASQDRRDKIKTKYKQGDWLEPLAKYPSRYISDNPIFDIFGNMEEKSLVLDDNKLPSAKILREKIRQSGRTLKYPKLNLLIIGIQDGNLIAKSLK
jgi:hypothetical protein